MNICTSEIIIGKPRSRITQDPGGSCNVLAHCIWGNPNIRTTKYQKSNDGSAASSLAQLSTPLPITE